MRDMSELLGAHFDPGTRNFVTAALNSSSKTFEPME
jgi:hypothetical protein